MKSLRKLMRFLKPYRLPVILAPSLMVLEVAMDLLQPRLMQRIVDVGIAQYDLSVVLHSGILMVGLAVLGIIGGMGCAYYAIHASHGVGADLRSALFHHIQSLSFGNLDTLKTGELVTRITNDVTQIQEVAHMMLRIMIRAPMMLVGSLIMAALTSPRLGLLLIVLMPLLALVLVTIIKRAQPMFSEVQRRLDAVNTVMQENLAGMRVVKAFVRAEHEKTRFQEVNDDLMTRTIAAIRTMSSIMPLLMVLLNLGIAAAIWLGGLQVIAGSMQVGQIMAFVNYLVRTLFSLMSVGMLVVQVSRAEASAERVVEVLESVPEIDDAPDANVDFAPQGRVEFRNVSFSYRGNPNEPVLQHINFVAEPGQVIAILGATGSGKSSLVNLIPRFYDVTEGQILIDGTDIRSVTQQALRSQIAVALQEAILFSGSVRDNIKYGRPEATNNEVIAAAKAAQAHEFITALPDGYDSQIGQRGVNLSGGQKQRLAIARALVAAPAVLILDDSTSAVDVETEAKLQDALAELMNGRTSFVIAQRISTVLNADKILVLDDGKLAGEGSHQELLAGNAIYREIYDSQLGGGESHA